MNQVAIKVENLSKRYRIGLKDEIHDTFAGALTSFIRSPAKNLRRLRRLTSFDEQNSKSEIRNSNSDDIIWALKDVSFEVKTGEVVGIIGRNGAGKSTLLKILSRITEPTSGRVEIYGRVSSLLEVGTGFHPELTGRENIYLNGTILGMRKAEIDRKFDQIVDFSGVEKFIDTPVKRYSSGMSVRLAFSIAAHLEPEILLVDEVLAVGDYEFQKKCLGKMEDVAGGGRTVLFVSHNMGAVQRLCPRSILLIDGEISLDGSSMEVVSTYLNEGSDSNSRIVSFNPEPEKPIFLKQIALIVNGKGEEGKIDISDHLEFEIQYCVTEDTKGANLSFAISREGVELFKSWDIDEDKSLFEIRKAGHYKSSIYLPDKLLSPGRYNIYVGSGRPGIGVIFRHPNCLVFEIESHKQDLSHVGYSRGGMLVVPLQWKTVRG